MSTCGHCYSTASKPLPTCALFRIDNIKPSPHLATSAENATSLVPLIRTVDISKPSECPPTRLVWFRHPTALLSPWVLTSDCRRISSPETRSWPARTKSKRSGASSTKLRVPGPTTPPINVFTLPLHLRHRRKPLIQGSCPAFLEIDLVKEGSLMHEPMDEWTFESRIFSKLIGYHC